MNAEDEKLEESIKKLNKEKKEGLKTIESLERLIELTIYRIGCMRTCTNDKEKGNSFLGCCVQPGRGTCTCAHLYMTKKAPYIWPTLT